MQVKQGLPGGITEAMTVHFIAAGQLYSYFSFLLSVAPPQPAPPQPAQTQKRAQVGETAQEISQNGVSQLRELAMASVCVCFSVHVRHHPYRMRMSC